MKFSPQLRNALLEAWELTLNGQTLSAGAGSGGSITGTAAPPRALIYTGAEPASTTAAATGTKLGDTQLPADHASAAANGTKASAGAWTGTALANGTPGYYRLVDSTGVCHEQATVTVAGGGGDAIIDVATLQTGQTFTISKTLTAPHA